MVSVFGLPIPLLNVKRSGLVRSKHIIITECTTLAQLIKANVFLLLLIRTVKCPFLYTYEFHICIQHKDKHTLMHTVQLVIMVSPDTESHHSLCDHYVRVSFGV